MRIKVLLSCPEDVIKGGNFLGTIDEIIQDANIYYFTKDSGFELELKHWKKNISLGRGEPRVQDRINYRLVDVCDIFIGILWTRFGSPPGMNSEGLIYEAGTEEEFCRAKNLSKELWIFFCDCPINPSKIDIEQLEKVRKFREALKREQIEYAEFSSMEEFRRQFKSSISEWVSKRYSIVSKEKEKLKEVIPQKEEFRKFNRGF